MEEERNCEPSPENNFTVHKHVLNTTFSSTAVFYVVWICGSNLIAVIWFIRDLYRRVDFCAHRLIATAVCTMDFLFGTMSVSVNTVNYFLGYCNSGGDTGCHWRGFALTFTTLSSQMMVVLLTIERFIALKFPFRHQTLMSKKRVLITICCLLCYTLFIALLPLMGVNRYGYRNWCDFYWNDKTTSGKAFVFLVAFEGFVLMSLIVICNFSSAYEVIQMRRKVATTSMGKSNTLEQTKFLVITTLVSLICVIASTPLLSRYLCNQLGVFISLNWDFVALRMNMVNNMVNAHLIFFVHLLFHPRLCARIKQFKERNKIDTAVTNTEIPITVVT